jgi:hypothetical protein
MRFIKQKKSKLTDERMFMMKKDLVSFNRTMGFVHLVQGTVMMVFALNAIMNLLGLLMEK